MGITWGDQTWCWLVWQFEGFARQLVHEVWVGNSSTKMIWRYDVGCFETFFFWDLCKRHHLQECRDEVIVSLLHWFISKFANGSPILWTTSGFTVRLLRSAGFCDPLTVGEYDSQQLMRFVWLEFKKPPNGGFFRKNPRVMNRFIFQPSSPTFISGFWWLGGCISNSRKSQYPPLKVTLLKEILGMFEVSSRCSKMFFFSLYGE